MHADVACFVVLTLLEKVCFGVHFLPEWDQLRRILSSVAPCAPSFLSFSLIHIHKVQRKTSFVPFLLCSFPAKFVLTLTVCSCEQPLFWLVSSSGCSASISLPRLSASFSLFTWSQLDLSQSYRQKRRHGMTFSLKSSPALTWTVRPESLPFDGSAPFIVNQRTHTHTHTHTHTLGCAIQVKRQI